VNLQGVLHVSRGILRRIHERDIAISYGIGTMQLVTARDSLRLVNSILDT